MQHLPLTMATLKILQLALSLVRVFRLNVLPFKKKYAGVKEKTRRRFRCAGGWMEICAKRQYNGERAKDGREKEEIEVNDIRITVL